MTSPRTGGRPAKNFHRSGLSRQPVSNQEITMMTRPCLNVTVGWRWTR